MIRQREPKSRRWLSLFLSAAVLAPAPALAAARRYDVTYLWHASLKQAFKRRRTVANLLGPRVAEELRVIAADGGYGVIYLRQGDRRGAFATAAAHSRVLRRQRLGKAWIVASRQWIEVSADGRNSPQAPAESRAAAAGHSAEIRQLEGLVEAHVEKLRREGKLAPDERTAWSVYDFTTGETLVEINTNLELQSASLIKPFLALAFMSQVEQGKLRYGRLGRREMRRMIQLSDNAAADWVLRRLGGPAAVQRLLSRRFAGLLPGVEIKEYIPRSGRTYRNKATAGDYSRFLLALWRDELPGSPEIKRLMALPKRDRLHTGVPLPKDVRVYSKTGSTSRLCGDIGVLMAKGPDGRRYAYTLIGIIEKEHRARHYLRWLRARGNVIRGVSYLMYRSVGALHGFAAAR
ncbi:MAG: serine hydrolase [Elusimicrobia bacterium]|nr:serine hydrolase [Elusimicrobiota bacterium]MDE2424804.1 serine hydrolase [Elusimicrobiota bacterium]